LAVALLLALIWVVVLVPPALRAQAARKEAFIISFGQGLAPAPDHSRPGRQRSTRVQRRRRIAGGLLVAMLVTLLMGLLPTFRVLLVVHLFLVDSFLAYIGLLAHMANLAARSRVAVPVAEAEAAAETPIGAARERALRWWRAREENGPVMRPELGTIAPLG
jgi:hypothetical protein